MTNKDKDANMFLNYENYLSSISNYQWKNIGVYNEYLDISLDDSFFTKNQMQDIDGDYYLAIQGLNDCFFNLYISTEDVKIMTLANSIPAGCSCETENDVCYFRYENINNPTSEIVEEQNIIFYTEFTYVKIIESCNDGYIRIWSFHSKELIKKIRIKANYKWLYGICLCNKFLFVGCEDNSIKILNLKEGLIEKELNGHNYKVYTIK